MDWLLYIFILIIVYSILYLILHIKYIFKGGMRLARILDKCCGKSLAVNMTAAECH